MSRGVRVLLCVVGNVAAFSFIFWLYRVMRYAGDLQGINYGYLDWGTIGLVALVTSLMFFWREPAAATGMFIVNAVMNFVLALFIIMSVFEEHL